MPSPLVVLGMSGGVDSSVAAWLLLERGYRVQGLFMSNWEEDEDGYCTAAEDYQDARKVCAQLDIPLHKVNFATEYRDRVFEHFLSEYRAGRTPNPDVLCNREIKFGVCFDYARRLGADLIATGHYARVQTDTGRPRLLRGIDGNKDQTYFLHAVGGEALAGTLFPLGELRKDEVRRIAKRLALPTHDKKDSTGICFIGERPFEQFLERYLPAQPGEIRSPAGQRLGQHRGLMFYTVGQRHGLGVGGRRGEHEAAWYVAAKDLHSNVLTVVQGHDHPALLHTRLQAADLHWIAGAAPSNSFACTAKVRYRQEDRACAVNMSADGTCSVEFAEAQRAITPGQYVVFYDAEVCLGGGVITCTDANVSKEPQIAGRGAYPDIALPL